MLYAILKLLTKIALKVFFRSFHVRGAEHIPQDRPLIVTANHPNTFMDALVVGAILRQPLYFLARGNLFSSPLMERLFLRLNLIPIYRQRDNPRQVGRNATIFRKCYDYLAAGKALLIFPEGVSIGARRLQAIQSGAARIALGAEEEHDFTLDIAILPVGLNYSDPSTFRSDVFVNIAPAIDVLPYRERYRDKSKPAINALTDEIRTHLAEVTVDAGSETFDTLAADIEVLYKTDLRKRMGLDPREKWEDFKLTKSIVDALRYFSKYDSERLEQARYRIRRYRRTLARLKLGDDPLKRTALRRSLVLDGTLSLLYVLLGLPLYLFGLLNNYLPYRIPGWVSPLVSQHREYHGPTKMTVGILTFGIFYGVQVWIAILLAGWTWLPAVYALALPLSGFFTLYYWEFIKSIRGSVAFLALFYKSGNLVARLVQERREIIAILEQAGEEYLAALAEQVNSQQPESEETA